MVARLAARDIRSSVGINLALLRRETGLDPWLASPSQLKAALLSSSMVEVPDQDRRRIPYSDRLLEEGMGAYYKGDEEEVKRVQSLLGSLCIN